MKRIFYNKFTFFCLLFLFCCFFVFCCTYQIKNSKKNITFNVNFSLDIVDDLENEIEDKLEDLNTKELDNILSELTSEEKIIFGEDDITEKIKNLINGTDNFEISDMFKVLISVLFNNISKVIPILASICAIAILSNLLMQMRGSKMSKSLGDIIHFACFGVIVVLIFGGIVELVSVTTKTLSSLKTQMEVTFPILLTLMASLGSTASVAIYQPLIAILCGIMMQVFIKIVLPIFSFMMIFNVIGNLTSTVKLTKFSSFLSGLFKTIIAFVFTIFTAFLAISGIVAGSYDSVSIRATKFAVKSYIPLVGGYISDGFNLIMASGVLIKNALGYTGIIIVFLTVISPLVKIYLYKLGLSLVSGIIEPVADKRVTEFVSSTAKSLSMLASIILAFSFAYIICVGLVMCSSNVV